jgi:hypothetical protein
VEDKEKHKFSHGEVTFLKKDLMLVTFGNKKVTLEAMMELTALRKKLLGSQPYYPVLDFRDGFVSFSAEAKTWAAANKESNSVRILDVFLVNNWSMKIECKLYLLFYKPLNVTKVASSLEEALEIIQNHKDSVKELA